MHAHKLKNSPKTILPAALWCGLFLAQSQLVPQAGAASIAHLVGKSADADACLESLMKRQDELTTLHEQIIGNVVPSLQTAAQRDFARSVAAVNPLPYAGTKPIALIECNRTLSDLIAALRVARMQLAQR